MNQSLTIKSLLEVTNKTHIENGRVSGVYFLYYMSNLVYVGQSSNIFLRIYYHKSRLKFDSFNYHIVNNEKDRKDLESELILKLRPEYNKNLKYKILPGCKYRSVVWDKLDYNFNKF
jgi:excinuclease UvrABC nuclease subunit